MKPEMRNIDRRPGFKRIFPFAIVLLSCVLASVVLWQQSELGSINEATSLPAQIRSL